MLMIRKENQPTLVDFFNDFFENSFENAARFLPKTNIVENEKAYEVEMMVPGFDKNDFQVNVEKDVLTVSVNKEMKKEEKKDNVLLFREFHLENFQRSFSLTKDVDVNKIEASYENGILKLRIPKKQEAVVKKLIKIK